MKNLSAILALAVLLTVGLACSDSGETTTSGGGNSTTATKTGEPSGATVESIELRNEAGETVKGFKQSEANHKASVKFSEFGAGKTKAVFTAVNADGMKNYKILEKELELTSLMNTANFTMILEPPTPKGSYKLDIYLDGKVAGTLNYDVQ